MQPLVTVSIPVFKCEDFLEKCLLSVLNQSYQNLEVTLINDQTPDHSVQIAEEFIRKYNLKNWKIYHLKENSGLSVVRNKGIDTAQGKYIFFLDSDDTITPDCIETLVAISERTGAEMTVSQLECEQLETGEKSICIKIQAEESVINGNDNLLKAFSEGKMVTYAVNKLFIVDYLRKNKLYFVKGLFAQDELWTFHLMLKMSKVAIHKGITYTYYLHKKSVIHNRNKRNFDNWFTIAQHIDQALKQEKNETRKRWILTYFINYKYLTLQMNWKAQQNESLWKESYANYKTLSSLRFLDYFSSNYSKNTKKLDFYCSLPTYLGFKLFKWRYEGMRLF
ncbi:glycosyltransferase [Bergeyella cardium]|uniref:Glycosyltransferase n=1 Tax=Bergeyella cardium TaxID=1585976 RepID=A0A6P1QYB6_9FLAO|nr:glycosyltransferase [Bergeyella cardium]QHN65700.1 glycosyltransferase [Bergeyella cardium]WHE33289.1 glycosyltransferase [Bergeyella cardium]WHF59938.1 glycosyltransferase [Bergeyella cardium]